jgi:hypothetical protein
MSKTKAFIVFAICLTVGILAFISSNPENSLRAGPSTTCLNGEPSAKYVNAAVAWVASRDGLSPTIALPMSVSSTPTTSAAVAFGSPLATPVSVAASPFGSPLATPTQSSVSPFSSPLPTPTAIPQNVGNYFIGGKRYFYAPELGKCYAEIAVIGQSTKRIDKVMVDVNSLAVSSLKEVDALRAGQIDPVQSKIDVKLKARLQTLSATDSVHVAIWLKTPPGEDVASRQERVFKQLIATYPQAAEFMRLYGKPLGVDDSPESKFIRQEYERLMNEGSTNTNAAAVKAALASRGVTTFDLSPIPVLVTTVSPQLVYELAADAAVEKIYLAEEKVKPALLDAAETQAFTPVWASGLTGEGQTIAILENGNVQQSNSYLNFEPYRLLAPNGEVPHTTRVAAAAASFYSNAPGSGLGAKILSVGTSTEQYDSIFGLQWATSSPQNATIVNNSEAVCTGASPELVSRGFDYWAYQNFVFITVAAGNEGTGSQYVCSPANAYNVLGVGAFNNNNTADWVDDSMYSSSSWRNPASPHSDREKPEVVAVGEKLDIWGWNNSLELDREGTSLAAPQVAGLGALLVKTNSSLAIWPEASKAIIMASAIHNIEGSPGISRTVDAKDGAGAIVADQAAAIASQRGTSSSPCYVSCWWGENLVGIDTVLSRYFFAQAGQRIRVAIAWWAIADASPYTNDVLDTDLELVINGPTGGLMGTSLSNDNNYELVDFVATTTGIHLLAVVIEDRPPTAPPNYVGIAVATTRYSIYLPAILR